MNVQKKNTEGYERYGLERLNALTDGVIAIALTLLVLGIDIPDDHNFGVDELKSFLIKLEPGLMAYVASFIVIAVYWRIHHRIYSVVAFSNNAVISLNILFLFSISLIPFLAKMKSLYRFDSFVIIIYSSAHIITGLILFLTWKYFMSRKGLCKYSIEKKKVDLVSLSILTIPAISLIAIPIAFVNIRVGTYLFFLIPIINIYLFQISKPLFDEKDRIQAE
jgi:uncharacterized membrane protein